MIRAVVIALLGVAPIALFGCVVGPGTGAPLPLGDPQVFAEEVQPVLAAGCANPSCHGSADRPLELYAPFMHRLDAERVHLDEPLTETELELNRRRSAALLQDCEDPDLSVLLTKPLAPDAGGCEHEGGVIFEDAWEQDYEALRGWASQAIEQAEQEP